MGKLQHKPTHHVVSQEPSLVNKLRPEASGSADQIGASNQVRATQMSNDPSKEIPLQYVESSHQNSDVNFQIPSLPRNEKVN
jgi:hypothetical protein